MRLALMTWLIVLTATFGGLNADEPPPLRGEDDTKAVEPEAADSDAPLPEGWPGAAEPGRVEVKTYPAYRSALARAGDASLKADNVLFFMLFNHIQQHDDAMTSPVDNTYRSPALVEEPGGTGEMTMEFLYRTPTQGETGPGSLAVRVDDHPASIFVCLGMQGDLDDSRLREGVKTLRAWLVEHEGEWAQDGPPRRLGYHGPMTPAARRRWEVQIPIRKFEPVKSP